jgi:hypothetical protein
MTTSQVDAHLRPRRAGMEQPGLAHTLRQAPYALSIVLFAAMLIAITAINPPMFGWDFRAFYDGGLQYLHLHTPYVSGNLAQLTTQENFVYPLPFAALLAPISLIPYTAAAVLFVIASGVLLFSALWLLGVRDWRVYAGVAIGMPTATAVGLGTISPLLAFLLALLWRFRDRNHVAAPVLAVLVLAKLFLWPVGLWFLLTRRFRVVAFAALGSVAALFLSALPFGMGVLTHYVSLLRSISTLEGPVSFSLSSLGSAFTGSSSFGTGVMLTAAAALVYAMVRSARRHEDERIFRLSIVAALAMSPVVWNHYLVLLFVPLALVRPRFSPAWLASAWVLGGGVGVLEGRTLGAVTAAVWAAILVQSGVVADVVAVRDRWSSRFVKPTLPLASSLLVWVALLWMGGAVSSAVPGAAALTPPSLHGSASGTATLRFLEGKNEVCWRILTTGLPAGTRVAIIDTNFHKALVDRPLRPGKSVGCARYTTPGHASLAQSFKRGRAHLRLTVTSSGGRGLLAGRIVSDLRDLKLSAGDHRA